MVTARIVYSISNFDDKPTKVSGLVVFPDVKKINGMISWQHPTEIKRNNVPSAPDFASELLACLFSGNPFLLVMPDYIGLGESQEVPTYLHASTTAAAVTELIKIARELSALMYETPKPKIFLGGFSQGAAATTAAQRKIESEGLFDLKAVAAIAGPYNLNDVSAKYSIQNNSNFNIAYLIYCYSNIYSIPLDSMVQEKYVGILKEYMDGSYTRTQVESQLPDSLYKWVRPNILEDFVTNNSNKFREALAENQTYRYKPQAPLRLYYGELDSTVSGKEVSQAKDYMDSLDGRVEVFSKGNANHVETFFASVPEIWAWWQELTQSQ
jgi:pimeloyl-ACP methyl ester carboxylesterase